MNPKISHIHFALLLFLDCIICNSRGCCIVCAYLWTIVSNVFCIMIIFLPVNKHPLVSAYVTEAAKNFKMLQLTCIGPFGISHAHSEGIIPKKKNYTVQLRGFGSVRYDALVLALKLCLKHDI